MLNLLGRGEPLDTSVEIDDADFFCASAVPVPPQPGRILLCLHRRGQLVKLPFVEPAGLQPHLSRPVSTPLSAAAIASSSSAISAISAPCCVSSALLKHRRYDRSDASVGSNDNTLGDIEPAGAAHQIGDDDRENCAILGRALLICFACRPGVFGRVVSTRRAGKSWIETPANAAQRQMVHRSRRMKKLRRLPGLLSGAAPRMNCAGDSCPLCFWVIP
jgi:hypothetical protein